MQHGEACSGLCASPDGSGASGRVDTGARVSEALCCSPETTTTSILCYTPIQNKRIKKKILYRNTTRQRVRKLPWLVGVGGDLCFYEFSIVKIIPSNKTTLNLRKENFTINSFSQFKLYLRENTYITIFSVSQISLQ